MNVLLQLIGLLLLVAVAVSLFSYTLFFYENSAPSQRLHKVERQRFYALLLRGFLTGAASLVIVFLSYPLGFVRGLWKPRKDSPSLPAIVLVHGLYHNAAAWLLMRHRLRRAGLTNIFVMNYSCFFTDFDSLCTKLDTFVRSHARTTTGRPLILIGHSLGGLLARAYAQRAAPESMPAAVITLGTPHNGSKVAAFGIGALAGQLMFHGPLFTALKQPCDAPPCPCVALVSPADSLVLPAPGLEPPPGWRKIETKPLSHVAMLYSREVAQKIIDILK